MFLDQNSQPFLSDLSNVSLQDLPSKDVQQKDGNSGSLGKRKQKTTAVMKESLDQEKEQDMDKKRRKGNMENENINGTNQLPTAKQKGKKANQKQQQETAAKSAVDSMGQLMFASKYGSKFPPNPTSPPYATPIPTASAPQAAHPLPAAHGDRVGSTKPPVPTAATALQARLLPAAYSNAATLTKPPTPTATAPQAAYLLPAVPLYTVPSTKSPTPTTLAPQAADLLPAEAIGDTEPSTDPPIPTSPVLQAAYSYQLPAAPDPALQASYPDTSISQTLAKCDRALVLSGLRDILNNPPRDVVIIIENDQNTPQQALLNKSTTPSVLGTFTVERNLQKIAAENKKLEVENTSLKAELLGLKGQLALMAPGE